MKLNSSQMEEYLCDPLKTDFKVRAWLGIKEDRYYSVSVWPEKVFGNVYFTSTHRVVHAKKVSKSDQS